MEEVNEEEGLKAWLLQNIVTRQRIDNQVVKVMEKVNDEDKPTIFPNEGMGKKYSMANAACISPLGRGNSNED